MLHEQGRVMLGVSVNLMVLQWVGAGVSSPLAAAAPRSRHSVLAAKSPPRKRPPPNDGGGRLLGSVPFFKFAARSAYFLSSCSALVSSSSFCFSSSASCSANASTRSCSAFANASSIFTFDLPGVASVFSTATFPLIKLLFVLEKHFQTYFVFLERLSVSIFVWKQRV